ncbi:hypothetical protein [Sulfurisoma sediminicola]|uniref:hypothetical protein n=1 Tax=Sulfurisoma sediminicola TaxID=1381557 RepID=UPI001404C58D|nr:hypothetical protein [Sulfurisoma sediminicola]
MPGYDVKVQHVAVAGGDIAASDGTSFRGRLLHFTRIRDLRLSTKPKSPDTKNSDESDG